MDRKVGAPSDQLGLELRALALANPDLSTEGDMEPSFEPSPFPLSEILLLSAKPKAMGRFRTDSAGENRKGLKASFRKLQTSLRFGQSMVSSFKGHGKARESFPFCCCFLVFFWGVKLQKPYLEPTDVYGLLTEGGSNSALSQ